MQNMQRFSRFGSCREHCSGELTQVLHLTQETCNHPEADTKSKILNSQLKLRILSATKLTKENKTEQGKGKRKKIH